MTQPRRINDGNTWLVTHTCSEQRAFLTPSWRSGGLSGMSKSEHGFLYLQGHYAEKYGLETLAYVVMSNHVHLVLHDPTAELPMYAQCFFGTFARYMNHVLGRTESFWCGTKAYSAVDLIEDDDVLEKVIYTIANPVRAGLVDRAAQFPGAVSLPTQIGRTRVFSRPNEFFNPKGDMPLLSKLTLGIPPGWEHREWLDAVSNRLRDVEREERAARRLTGRRVLGEQAIRSADPFQRMGADRDHLSVSPNIACRDPERRVEAIEALVAWRNAYRGALELWQSGRHSVEFPLGTWKMRVVHRALCCGPP